jgi:hypothetical protein
MRKMTKPTHICNDCETLFIVDLPFWRPVLSIICSVFFFGGAITSIFRDQFSTFDDSAIRHAVHWAKTMSLQLAGISTMIVSLSVFFFIRKKQSCTCCGGDRLIPLGSPKAKRLMPASKD